MKGMENIMNTAISTLEFTLNSAVSMAIPLLLAATGEIFVQRSGCINMGMEGMMLMGAFIGVVGSIFWGRTIGFLLCIVAGVLLGLFVAFMCVIIKASQPIVGVVLNLFATGATSFFYRYLMGITNEMPTVQQLGKIEIPLLSQIPVIGCLFQQNILTYAAFILVPISSIILFKTNYGLKIRAVGGNAEAADTMGISVVGIRFVCWIIGGVLATLAGAFLSFSVGLFADGMSSSRGFIALALVLFSRWNPFRALFGAFLFGIADSIQLQLQAASVNIPYQLLVLLPYVLTILIMAFSAKFNFVNPAVIGVPYSRESKEPQ